MDTKLLTQHVITKIEPKPSARYNIYHEEILNRPCLILNLKEGEMAWIGIATAHDGNQLHRYHTTTVLSITEAGDDTIIETKNTVYTLTKASEDQKVLCGVQFDPAKYGFTGNDIS